ncbi:hypothetical protein CDAR_549481 [Caerostris darwini]|uniref:Uncharacterized protein n=1 Tax=Caerostris darwini TaxID=1538125 RepID=A0AAV4QH81_9ARAC|nr:hypothetical protein CDAR_549481 [Caerostris darwini]
MFYLFLKVFFKCVWEISSLAQFERKALENDCLGNVGEMNALGLLISSWKTLTDHRVKSQSSHLDQEPEHFELFDSSPNSFCGPFVYGGGPLHAIR